MLMIDRFEGDTAVCETTEGQMVEIPRRQLPPEAREGSVLLPEGKGYRLDLSEEDKRRARIKNLQNRLWRK